MSVFNFNFIKKHPYGSGAAVLVGGLVLFLLLRGGSSSSGAQDQAGLATQQVNTALAAQQDAEQAQYQMAQLQAQTAQNIATIQSYQDITLGTQANQNQQLQINKAAEVQSQAIAAQLQESTLQSNNQTQVQLAGISANEQMQKNQLQAAVDQTNTLASLQAHLTDTNAALQQNITQLNTQAQVAITQINANTQQNIANTQASVQKHSSDNSSWVSTVGTIAGVAAAFFCDVNLKCKTGCVSTADCLEVVKSIPLVKFTYLFDTEPRALGDDREHVNTYSQDFYKALGVADYENRTRLEVIDMMGVLCGAIKELEVRRAC